MRISGWVCGLALLLPLPPAGAAAGPAHLVADLKTGFDPFDPNSSADFNSYLAVDGRVVFLGFLRPFGDCGLWVASAAGGAERLADLCGGRTIDSVFTACGDTAAGLWGSDGTAAGTVPLPGTAGGTAPILGQTASFKAPLGDRLLFVTDPADSNPSPDGRDFAFWTTDGSPQGTREAFTRRFASGPDRFYVTAAVGLVYFLATSPESGYGIWRTDGTAAGTTLVRDILPGPASSTPGYLTAADGALYFTADDGEHGRELWALPLPR